MWCCGEGASEVFGAIAPICYIIQYCCGTRILLKNKLGVSRRIDGIYFECPSTSRVLEEEFLRNVKDHEEHTTEKRRTPQACIPARSCAVFVVFVVVVVVVVDFHTPDRSRSSTYGHYRP